MRTYSAKPTDIHQKWYIIDAKDLVLGRLSSIIAKYLRGKHKPMFSPNIDCGDQIVVINADKVKLTGNNKLAQQMYYKHTGYPGGLKEINAQDVLRGRFPERVLEKAVQRMLDRWGPMGRAQFKKLHAYAGEKHPHEAQKPEVLDIASLNRKNKRSA